MTAAMKLKDTYSLELKLYKPRQHIKKQKHYLPTKVCLVKAMAFPVVVYRCESQIINKAECQRFDALDCGAVKDLRVPWTARRSNQSILKEINPGTEAEVPILWPPDAKSQLIGKDLDARKD